MLKHSVGCVGICMDLISLHAVLERLQVTTEALPVWSCCSIRPLPFYKTN